MKIGKRNQMQVGNQNSFKLPMSRQKNFVLFTRIAVVVVLIIGLIWAQNGLLLNKSYIFESERIPKSFVGYKIVYISDLFNKTNGVASKVNRENPDIILCTGNLTDDNGRFGNSVDLLNKLASKYTVYYVLGEYDIENKDSIISSLNGPINIENNRVSIQAPEVDIQEFVDTYIGSRYKKQANKGNTDAQQYINYTVESLENSLDSVIEISGLPVMEADTDFVSKAYEVLNYDKEIFQIMLMNQSQYFNSVCEADVDLIMSGNTGGTNYHNNGYSKGMFTNYGTTMFLNSGIGTSDKFGPRIFNFPSITTITLSDGTIDNSNPLERILGMFVYDVKTRFDDDGGFKKYTEVYDNNTYLDYTW